LSRPSPIIITNQHRRNDAGRTDKIVEPGADTVDEPEKRLFFMHRWAEPYPSAASLDELVLDFHADRGADAGEVNSIRAMRARARRPLFFLRP
jgi:hypothetical protein